MKDKECATCKYIAGSGADLPCFSCDGKSKWEQGAITSKNNGGKTDYYDIPEKAKCAQDIIEERKMNFSQGNIFKSAFCFNVGRHTGSDYVRELNKIIWFANREKER